MLQISYFTDPLCCWSWAFEPQWRLLRYAHAGRLGWRIRMGGMIRRWDAYQDPLNAIYRPGQMGPLWMQAERQSGMPMGPNVWIDDPPDSSWPACLAVKTAELQSPLAADRYLRLMREALMIEGRNIARRETLLDIAERCAAALPGRFDAAQFERDVEGQAAHKAFQDDMAAARLLGIGRFPALLVHRQGAGEKVLTGWRPYHVLVEELQALAPELGGGRRPRSENEYRAYWGGLTSREIAEALGERDLNPGAAAAGFGGETEGADARS